MLKITTGVTVLEHPQTSPKVMRVGDKCKDARDSAREPLNSEVLPGRSTSGGGLTKPPAPDISANTSAGWRGPTAGEDT